MVHDDIDCKKLVFVNVESMCVYPNIQSYQSIKNYSLDGATVYD